MGHSGRKGGCWRGIFNVILISFVVIVSWKEFNQRNNVLALPFQTFDNRWLYLSNKDSFNIFGIYIECQKVWNATLWSHATQDLTDPNPLSAWLITSKKVKCQIKHFCPQIAHKYRCSVVSPRNCCKKKKLSRKNSWTKGATGDDVGWDDKRNQPGRVRIPAWPKCPTNWQFMWQAVHNWGLWQLATAGCWPGKPAG